MGAYTRERFAGLDLLRGMAAIAVLVLHYPWPEGSGTLPRGYLAVDLFFVLSGFVIAHAYGRRLEQGMTTMEFCVARLIRFYPLYIAGTLFAAFYALRPLLQGWEVGYLGEWVSTVATAVFFFPTPQEWSVHPEAVFPLNVPAWSLFWELWVNFLFAVVAFRLGGARLGLIVAAAAAWLAFMVHEVGIAGLGWDWAGFGGGSARACFGFFTGVAVFRLRSRWRAPRLPSWSLTLLLIALFLPPPDLVGWQYDLTCQLVVFPALIWLGAESTSDPQMSAASELLGYMSYPVYILHGPAAEALWTMGRKLLGVELSEYVIVGMPLYVAFVAALSWAAARWFDEPARRWLRGQLTPEVPRPRAQAAP